jgi:hypothetical protein
MSLSVNILCNIDICFIALVHVNYLVFLQRMKHVSLWLGNLFLPVLKRHLLFHHFRLRIENGALRLDKRLAHGGLRAPLVLEVAGEGQRRLWLMGLY